MDIEKIKDELRAEFAAEKAEFTRIQAEKDAEIARLKDETETARKREFTAKVEATFSAATGKIPAAKIEEIKAVFGKENVTMGEILDGLNAMFSAMPNMVESGKLINNNTGDAILDKPVALMQGV